MRIFDRAFAIIAAGGLVAMLVTGTALPQSAPSLHDTALEILETSVAYRTVAGSGQVPVYAKYLQGVLLTVGYAPADVRVESLGDTATLTARYRGRDPKKKPILLLGHMDVVEARREDWQRDPFVAVVENGYVYGRGVYDNKFDVSVMVATLAKLKRAGWKPARDVILALSGDEETTATSSKRLAQQLRGAELALNSDEGGGVLAEEGVAPVLYLVQGGEKTYSEFTLTATDPGGHSSRPTKSNAIDRLAHALEKVAAYEFPVVTNELTRAAFKAAAPITPGTLGDAMRRYVADPSDRDALRQLSDDPDYVGQLRTTCVATLVSGGHASNALPQRAVATLNCRIFPGTSAASVRQTLVDVIADASVAVEYNAELTIESGVSPLRPDVLAAVSKAVHARYPRLPVIPYMSPAATDGTHFRAQGVPTYGVSGVFIRSSDNFIHGLNERVPVGAIDGALAHWDVLIRELAR